MAHHRRYPRRLRPAPEFRYSIFRIKFSNVGENFLKAASSIMGSINEDVFAGRQPQTVLMTSLNYRSNNHGKTWKGAIEFQATYSTWQMVFDGERNNSFRVFNLNKFSPVFREHLWKLKNFS